MDSPVEFSVKDRIARITLNRPEAGNAFNADVARGLAQAALACDLDPSVKVVLLSANGRMFCAGGDLKAFASYGDQVAARLKEMADELHKAISTFSRMTKPLVIAVNGPAAGAGFSLSLIGDIVFAVEGASFTIAYTAAGLSPDGSSTWFLPRLVGMRRAQELALTNRTLTAADALEWGLVTRVVPNDDLEESALKMCRQLAAGPAIAQGTAKALLLQSSNRSLEEQMEVEGRGISQAGASRDGLEGVKAFIEKRRPAFA